MKNVMSWLQGTKQVEVKTEVVRGIGRDLTLSELSLVAGGMQGVSVNVTRSNSGGAADDSLDSGGDSIDL